MSVRLGLRVSWGAWVWCGWGGRGHIFSHLFAHLNGHHALRGLVERVALVLVLLYLHFCLGWGWSGWDWWLSLRVGCSRGQEAGGAISASERHTQTQTRREQHPPLLHWKDAAPFPWGGTHEGSQACASCTSCVPGSFIPRHPIAHHLPLYSSSLHRQHNTQHTTWRHHPPHHQAPPRPRSGRGHDPSSSTRRWPPSSSSWPAGSTSHALPMPFPLPVSWPPLPASSNNGRP